MASVRVNGLVNSNLSIIILWNIKIITFVPELHFESTFIHGPPELCYLLQEFLVLFLGASSWLLVSRLMI